MSNQLQTLRDIYERIADIQQKICLDNEDTYLSSHPTFSIADNAIDASGQFGFNDGESVQGLNDSLFFFVLEIQNEVNSLNLEENELEALANAINAQFRVIEWIVLPRKELVTIVVKTLVETLLLLISLRLAKNRQRCYFAYAEIDNLNGSTAVNLSASVRVVSMNITNYPNTFGRLFSGNEDVPNYLIEPIYITFFEPSKGWSAPIRIRFLQQKIDVPDCSTKLAVIAPLQIEYRLRLYE